MFGIGGPELVVLLLILVIPYWAIYSAYKKNLLDRRPPKSWVAVVLTLIPPHIGGIVYARGPIAGAFGFGGLVALLVVTGALVYATVGGSATPLAPLISLLPLIGVIALACIAGWLAERTAEALTSEHSAQPGPAAEQRLKELQRLLDQQLISLEEYQKKRATIVDGV